MEITIIGNHYEDVDIIQVRGDVTQDLPIMWDGAPDVMARQCAIITCTDESTIVVKKDNGTLSFEPLHYVGTTAWESKPRNEHGHPYVKLTLPSADQEFGEVKLSIFTVPAAADYANVPNPVDESPDFGEQMPDTVAALTA